MASADVPMVLVGSKSDLVRKRVIGFKKAEALALKIGIPYVDTSAKTGQGVNLAFDTLGHLMVTSKESKMQEESKLWSEAKKPAPSNELPKMLFARFSCNVL
jgi:GTPase SAR1 family protein